MKLYGLIGHPLTHSFSGKYFADKFQREGIEGHDYRLFPIPRIEDLKELLEEHPDLAGLNVTIPYKEQVIPYLDELSPVVEKIGACNCIKIKNGKLTGYNTDVIGFRKTLEPKLLPHHDKALVLGTGGAAKAVCHVLEELQIGYTLVSRHPVSGGIQYEQIDQWIMASHRLIINTTPLGMHPKVDEAPRIPYEEVGPSHYLYDLVYNPDPTLFLMQGREQGAVTENGSEMLVIQAEASWEIWNQG